MKAEVQTKILISPNEASSLTGISPGTILRWCKEKKPFVTKVGRNYKISQSLFRNWIDEQCMAGVDLVEEKEF